MRVIITKKSIILTLFLISIFMMSNYQINTSKTEINYKFLFVIISNPNHMGNRKAIRETWGNRALIEKINSKLIFFMGHHKTEQINFFIKFEQKIYNDIIIGNFIEDYYNLTLKVETALNWALNEFKIFQYFLKVDDDVFLNTENLILYLEQNMNKKSLKVTDQFIFCHLNSKYEPSRNLADKWYITTEDFPDSVYPDYCSGHTYLIAKSAINKLLNDCQYVKKINFDDVFLTGICREKADILLLSNNKFALEDSNICKMKSYITQYDLAEDLLRSRYNTFKNCF